MSESLLGKVVRLERTRRPHPPVMHYLDLLEGTVAEDFVNAKGVRYVRFEEDDDTVGGPWQASTSDDLQVAVEVIGYKSGTYALCDLHATVGTGVLKGPAAEPYTHDVVCRREGTFWKPVNQRALDPFRTGESLYEDAWVSNVRPFNLTPVGEKAPR